jgi:hypothetical protein
MGKVSRYWEQKGVDESQRKHGRTYEIKGKFGCDECCNGDRCDEPTHKLRPECPYCLGTGENLSCVREQENRDWEISFDLYHNAMKRGLKKFRELNPDYPELMHPDAGIMIENIMNRFHYLESLKKGSLRMLKTVEGRIEPLVKETSDLRGTLAMIKTEIEILSIK